VVLLPIFESGTPEIGLQPNGCKHGSMQNCSTLEAELHAFLNSAVRDGEAGLYCPVAESLGRDPLIQEVLKY
jgi:hypothetical protein